MTFFERLKTLANDGGNVNVINEIFKYNDMSFDCMTTDAIRNMKLNDDLINDVFNNFSFKYLSRKSSHMIIVKNVINTFFNKDIIKRETDISKHCSYYIDDVDKDMFYNSRYLKHFAYCLPRPSA